MRRILWLLGVVVVAGVTTQAGRARQCGEYQCAWANLGEDPECYDHGDTVEIPCCSIKCVCSEDPDDCIWQIGTEDR